MYFFARSVLIPARAMHLSIFRRIFVYNNCLNRINVSVSDRATKVSITNEHGTFNCPHKFEPDAFNTFCVTRV